MIESRLVVARARVGGTAKKMWGNILGWKRIFQLWWWKHNCIQ